MYSPVRAPVRAPRGSHVPCTVATHRRPVTTRGTYDLTQVPHHTLSHLWTHGTYDTQLLHIPDLATVALRHGQV